MTNAIYTEKSAALTQTSPTLRCLVMH